MASGFIIKWNCRGLAANSQELELLAQKYTAPVICLQETILKGDQMTLKGYVAYHKSGTIDDMDGGVSIFVKNNLSQSCRCELAFVIYCCKGDSSHYNDLL